MEGFIDQEVEAFITFIQEERYLDPEKEIEIQKWILAMILNEF